MNTIRETNLECQELLDELAVDRTLSLMVVIAWQIARIIAVNLVEEVLAQRAQAATEWDNCPKCSKRLQSNQSRPTKP